MKYTQFKSLFPSSLIRSVSPALPSEGILGQKNPIVKEVGFSALAQFDEETWVKPLRR